MKYKTVPFETLLGLTICAVKKDDEEVTTELLISTNENRYFRMFHQQDCCESVYLYDICGNLDDLIGSKILKAEESTNYQEKFGVNLTDSFTWTFYHISVFGASVTLRWLGESNGYYSESVTLQEIFYE